MEQVVTKSAVSVLEYGLLGVFCLVLASTVYFLYRSHQQERKEWRNDAREEREKRDTEFNAQMERNRKATEELTKVLHSLLLNNNRHSD